MENIKNRKDKLYYEYGLWILNGDYLTDSYDEEKNEYTYYSPEDNCFKIFIRKLVQIFVWDC